MRKVRLQNLPRPDCIEIEPETTHVCAIKDDGGSIAPRMASRLKTKGWQVVLLRTSSVPPDHNLPTVIVAEGTEGAWSEALASVHGNFGPIETFIDLISHTSAADDDALLDSGADLQLRESFFIAKHLKSFMATSYARYFAVAQIDGKLGLGGAAEAHSIVAGGIFGLAKTLRHEWTNTYCRAIDLSPELDNDTATERLIDELLDPDCNLSEVGVDPHGRYTIISCEADHA